MIVLNPIITRPCKENNCLNMNIKEV